MLTGKTRYRVGWRKKLVLQVEHANPLPWPHGFHYPGHVGWRDAAVEDMQAISRGEVMKGRPEPKLSTGCPPPPPKRNQDTDTQDT